MLLRRQLPILSPCDRFEADPNDPERCVPCARAVHDLGKLDEAEVVALVASHGGRGLCVAYATRADGSIATRRPTRATAPLLATMLLGCAGYGHDPAPATEDSDRQLGDRTVVPDAPPPSAPPPDDAPPHTTTGREVDMQDFYDIPIAPVQRGFVSVITPATPEAAPTMAPTIERTPAQRRRDERKRRRAARRGR